MTPVTRMILAAAICRERAECYRNESVTSPSDWLALQYTHKALMMDQNQAVWVGRVIDSADSVPFWLLTDCTGREIF